MRRQSFCKFLDLLESSSCSSLGICLLRWVSDPPATHQLTGTVRARVCARLNPPAVGCARYCCMRGEISLTSERSRLCLGTMNLLLVGGGRSESLFTGSMSLAPNVLVNTAGSPPSPALANLVSSNAVNPSPGDDCFLRSASSSVFDLSSSSASSISGPLRFGVELGRIPDPSGETAREKSSEVSVAPRLACVRGIIMGIMSLPSSPSWFKSSCSSSGNNFAHATRTDTGHN
mmetsp:Transcript_18771/g.35032  ORF Transcript_18771/g.35032 Transcript_18771/m.35032 type:complete len:232 (-) Transcript_18771:400-1095(-)